MSEPTAPEADQSIPDVEGDTAPAVEAEADEADDEIDVVYVLGEGGTVFKLGLPLSEAIEDRLAKGYIRLVNEDGSDINSERERPADTARKLVWVGWAVHCGADPNDAEALTKHDLIDKYGSPQP